MFDFISKEVLTVVIAALPVAELRGAIPLAIFAWGITPFNAYVLGVVGNFLPVVPLLFFLEVFSASLVA